MDFAGKKFENVETTIGAKSLTILGLEMINYGKVVIDYSRNRFFFLPYSTDVVKSTPLEKRWDVAILPSEKGFEVTAVWGHKRG